MLVRERILAELVLADRAVRADDAPALELDELGLSRLAMPPDLALAARGHAREYVERRARVPTRA